MAGGYHSPEKMRRERRSLADRVAQTHDQSVAQESQAKPQLCTVHPDGGQPLRAEVVHREQAADGAWLITLKIPAP